MKFRFFFFIINFICKCLNDVNNLTNVIKGKVVSFMTMPLDSNILTWRKEEEAAFLKCSWNEKSPNIKEVGRGWEKLGMKNIPKFFSFFFDASPILFHPCRPRKSASSGLTNGSYFCSTKSKKIPFRNYWELIFIR